MSSAILTAERLREIEAHNESDLALAGEGKLAAMGAMDAVSDRATLLADARAMRELVRRALDDRLKVVVGSPDDEYFLLCDCCDNHVVVTGYARATAHPYRGVCTCAPGVSWVRDAIAAGLHNERKP